MESKGWIALDIDGTITLDKYSVPKPVTAYLRKLQGEGWRIAMATGRPFRFAAMALSEFDFPYLCFPQNGSGVLEMPGEKVLFKRFLSWEAIPVIEQAFEGIDSDFIVYMGFDKNDLCYFRPHRFSKDDASSMANWQERQRERWQAVEQFTPELLQSFSLVKCFGPFDRMEKIAKRLQASNLFQVALMRDPFDAHSAIVLITDSHASKGLSLQEAFRRLGRGPLVIAAGDDANDVSLLNVADIKIAMSHAPDVLQEIADFIAPPTAQQGIITALQLAIRNGKRIA